MRKKHAEFWAILTVCALSLILAACRNPSANATVIKSAETTEPSPSYNPSSTPTVSPTSLPVIIIANTITVLLPSFTPVSGPSWPAIAKPCRAVDLAAEIKFFNGATGWSIGDIFFTNISANACTIQGYAELQLLDEKGQPDTTFHYNKLEGSFDTSGETSQGVVAIQPGKAAAAGFWSYRCDEGYAPNGGKLVVVLPSAMGQLFIDNAPHRCENVNDMSIGSFKYAPDNWQTLP